MTGDPSLPLQKAVYGALTQSVGASVYHTVPAGASLPWTVIGEDQILSDYEAADFSECHVTVHVFAANLPSAKTIATTVRKTLDTKIAIDGWDTVEGWFEESRTLTEADGQTRHIVMTFRYLVIERPA